MTCPCCSSEESVFNHVREPGEPILPDHVDGAFANAPLEMHCCQVCGYKWERMEHSGTKQEVILHDLSPAVAGQVNYDAPQDVLMEKRARGAPAYFRIKRQTHEHEKIGHDEFRRALDRRQTARRGAVRN